MFKRLLLSTMVVALGSGAIAAQDDCRGVRFTNDTKRGLAFYRTPIKAYKSMDDMNGKGKNAIVLRRIRNDSTDITQLLLFAATASDDWMRLDYSKPRHVHLEFEDGASYHKDSADVWVTAGFYGVKGFFAHKHVQGTVLVDAELKNLLLTKKLRQFSAGGYGGILSEKIAGRLPGWTYCITNKDFPNRR